MFHYSPSPRSLDYTSYLPRRSYRPASFDLYDHYDAPSSAFPFEDLGYSSSPHNFLAPRTNAETRYRRALYELEAAEQEYEAHVALERGRQVAALRQRATAEAARIKREDALYAEIERAKRARSLQAQAEEMFGQRQRAFRAQTGFDRVHHGGRGLLDALVHDGGEGVSMPLSFEGRRCRSQATTPLPTHHDPLNRAHRDGRALLRALVNDDAEGVAPRLFESRPSQATGSSTHRDNGIATLGDLLGLFGDVQGRPEPEAARQSQKPCSPAALRPSHPAESQTQATGSSVHRNNEMAILGDLLGVFGDVQGRPEPEAARQSQKPSSPAASQPSHRAESQTQPRSGKHADGEVNFSDILNFFHGIAAQARDAAGGEQSAHERGTSSQPEAAHADRKGKGKAKAQPVPERTFYDLLHEHVNGGRDQELRDLEYAIKLSLQDRDIGDVKKAEASKASRSSPGACSSNLSVEVPVSSGHAASQGINATSVPVATPSPQPVSPLTTIRAVRTQFSALESAFKLPLVLDFEDSELAVSSNNTPVRAYEQALAGLLERLDAIESDGDEEVRVVRREVVREVERALEDVERKVKDRAPQVPVPEVANSRDGESEDPNSHASATPDVLPAVVEVAEDVKPTQPDVASVVFQADADIDLAISGEYQTASPVAGSSEAAVTDRDDTVPSATTKEETSILNSTDLEAVPARFEDASDSITTITPTPAVPAPSPSIKGASTPSAPETFLTSMSHDQFTFPPRPAFSQSGAGAGVAHDEDAVLVDHSSEGSSARGAEEEWTEFDA